jgi:hypothetical protein
MRGWGDRVDRETKSFNKSLKVGIDQERRVQSKKDHWVVESGRSGGCLILMLDCKKTLCHC